MEVDGGPLHLTGWTRHDLPADITVHAGDFASQPAVFAHLLTDCPTLDLTHVEVIRGRPAAASARAVRTRRGDEIATVAARWDSIVAHPARRLFRPRLPAGLRRAPCPHLGVCGAACRTWSKTGHAMIRPGAAQPDHDVAGLR